MTEWEGRRNRSSFEDEYEVLGRVTSGEGTSVETRRGPTDLMGGDKGRRRDMTSR